MIPLHALAGRSLLRRRLRTPPASPLPVAALHTRSLRPHRDKPASWNTTHASVLADPLLSLLERCRSLSQLMQVQAQMVATGLASDGLALSRLVAFCALSESRDLGYCARILCGAADPNAFSWNVAIRGFAESDRPGGALALYRRMLRNGGSRPDNYTYPLLLKICAADSSMKRAGRGVLGHVVKLGFEGDLFVCNAVIHMVVSWGEVGRAREVFDGSPVRDLVTWNSLINGYVRSGLADHALRMYREMEAEGVTPDEVTMIGMVCSCAQLEDLKLGREFHQLIERNGLNLTVPLANALMDMYIKCGDLEQAQEIFDNMKVRTFVTWTTMVVGYARFGFLDTAREIFDGMPQKDVVPWNALIGGYVQAYRSKEALALFHEMQSSNTRPDEVTMVNCLSACSQLGALEVGIWIHHYIEKHKLSLNVALGTALIDMYAKCGDIPRALRVFLEMPVKNSLTWTALICGLAHHGYALDAITFFREMIGNGLKPDEVTFLGLLSACCHGGLVEAGRNFFSQMTSEFNLFPRLKHYSCMVDLLGRAGLLEEAMELIESMPMEADAAVWGPLFFACRVHRNVLLGQKVALELLKLDPHDSGTYVLLANMYREANMWEEARKVRKMMTKRGVEKTPGCSSIEVNGVVHEFIVRDKSHPQSEWIYQCLVILTRQLHLVENMVDISNLGDHSL
ncbi:pentatricopeptide repeat-containing protein At2g22410, mitochondrial [Eucalyptus grandis]|uniref:pentatricopeptide repeat-containing protein At2g22410, mitochondrial n=1 Tax=Eucalyptus grandis TaxID=71139 RepID=UPI00192EC0AC|nr:pentatricopeptide repeat-containing protein At2g22410, mitochondrial [Eucalyptus grandis]XP_039159005.1 pentatricopeptide repeat-containing protein At2g22410, mitochondrial [Eucalyptus grandis]XP_039159006.1 pentatricopeptide repeat-containing protein At2g22410, mitochondrial [Eucalyptus grandis]XP_039159007.1 pentatricopeptide repeat-containing protein At2g22410, mitochondrial [Eucalyptus grandis]XP_039159008.1 pentatricopeptide repeat-containing protein At2g22410, mitochondrial [Eucalyptus